MSRSFDVAIVGAGPAGLAAALALGRRGASVCVVDRAEHVGGLCVTRGENGARYDVGGHVLFVRSSERQRWLERLLDGDLLWVDRPVSSVQRGGIVPGRYLDHAAGSGGPPARPDQGGAAYLDAMDGPGSEVARAYLEKIDGAALEDIPAVRVERLLVGQSAPDGFFYPRNGIGQLMLAMAREVRSCGGTVMVGTAVEAIDVGGARTRGLVVRGPDGSAPIATGRVIVAVPVGHAAQLALPKAPASATPDLRMRAVCIVYLAIDADRLSPEPWVQVDDARVPFARLFEPVNWSPSLTRPGRTIVGCECYCHGDSGDPIWGQDDASLGRLCATRLHDPLGLIERPDDAELVEVVRIPRAYPIASVAEMALASEPARWLAGVAGIELAQGGAVIEAFEAGEAAAGRALAAL